MSEHERHQHNRHSHAFENVEEFAAKFDNPERDQWQRPDEIIDFIDLSGAEKFADIGAGTGYFSVRAAARLKNGTVFAVDSEPKMLEYIGKRCSILGLRNVQTIQTSHADIELPTRVDVIFLANTFHHIEDRTVYFTHLKRFLLPNGKLVIVEGKPNTPMEQPPEFRVTEQQITSELKTAGFDLIKESDILPHQYLLLFQSKS